MQRQCACGNHTVAGGECEACATETAKLELQRSAAGAGVVRDVPPIVHDALRSSAQPLDPRMRAFMEPRFGHDFSGVRVHADTRAAESARSVDARAYTVGRDVVFGAGQYAPDTTHGRALLAHELAHVVQQRAGEGTPGAGLTIGQPSTPAEQEADTAANAISNDRQASVSFRGKPQIARAPCTAAAICSGGPITGSAQEADVSGTALEVSPRARRQKMTPKRAVATGHAGRALQLERLLEKSAPGKLSSLQGIFIDQDISPAFEATTISCAQWITGGVSAASASLPAGSPTPPGMAGTTKPCTFVHDYLNQQALAFNTTTDATIGGKPRERWRTETLETLIHETEHPRYEAATAAQAAPAGVTSPTCQRATILQELSELAAIFSEFPTALSAASAEADPHGPLHASLDQWFDNRIQTSSENIKAALAQMGCQCSCPEVDAFVVGTFNFESASWSVAEKDAFHRELTKPKWDLKWPLHPSTP